MAVRISLLIGILAATIGRPPLPACGGERAIAVDRGASVVRIVLRPHASVFDRIVLVRDVADLDGGAGRLDRERIGELDLVELDATTGVTEVTRTLVHARLLLSRIPADVYHLTGAQEVSVRLQTARAAEERAVHAARLAVAERLSLPPEDVLVHLAQPLSSEGVQLISATSRDLLEARLAAGAGGRTRIELWTSDDQQQRRVTPIAVDVRFRQLVPVAARPLTARRMLTADDVSLEHRDVAQRSVWLTSAQIEGKALRRSLSAGEIITERDLIAAVDASGPVLIKPRDPVRITARKGKLMLTLPGAEALQSGREGEMIRVRNPSSGRIVQARVVAEGEVEVPL